jgi:hypothetical protein
MLDLTALPKRYLEQLGRERVAEMAGVSTSDIAAWVERGEFPVSVIQKLLEQDPTPLHEVAPLYTVPERGAKLSIIVPTSTGRHPLTDKCLDKLKTAEMEIEPESFNSLYHVRNMAAARFLASGREWSFWSDADMIHPCGDAAWFKRVTGKARYPDIYAGMNTIHRLLVHKKSIVSVVYIEKISRGLVQFQGGDNPSRRQMLSRGPSPELITADWCGFGGVLVHRSVFVDVAKGGFAPRLTNDYMRKKLGYEWGFFNPAEEHFGDDISFCIRAKNAGHQTYIDCAVMSEHIGTKCYGFEDLR